MYIAVCCSKNHATCFTFEPSLLSRTTSFSISRIQPRLKNKLLQNYHHNDKAELIFILFSLSVEKMARLCLTSWSKIPGAETTGIWAHAREEEKERPMKAASNRNSLKKQKTKKPKTKKTETYALEGQTILAAPGRVQSFVYPGSTNSYANLWLHHTTGHPVYE